MRRFDARSTVNRLLDGMPYGFVLTTAAITAAAILSLLLVDVITGAILVDYKFKDVLLSTSLSLATTGVLTVVLASGVRGLEGKWPKWSVVVIFGIAIVIIGADTYLDGMAVDVKTFGGFVAASTVFTNPAELLVHYVLRGLVAGISLVGEPLAAMAIAIFPIIKDLFNKMVDGMDKIKTNQPALHVPRTGVQPSVRPASSPATQGRIPGITPRVNPRPTPAVTSRPLYNEPTYQPIGMTPRDHSTGNDR